MGKSELDGMEGVTPVSEQAAGWWVTLHAEDAGRGEQVAFGEWVAKSPERVAAYLRVARLMRALKGAEVQWPDVRADVLVREAKAATADVVEIGDREAAVRGTARADVDRVGRRERVDARGARPRFVLKLSAAAASVAIAFAAAWVILSGPKTYETAFGEQRSVLLADGSLVTLNTASTIEVELSEERRLVQLIAGEALFQVTRDEKRPFEVVAGDTRIRAVGTQFNVDRRTARTIVTVVEGKVAVATGAPDAALDERPERSSGGIDSSDESVASRGLRESGRTGAKPQTPLILTAAERVVVTGSHVSAPERIANVAVATAWTQRRLVFERRPLGEVAEEFNRYNRDAILIEDEALRNQAVTGVFQANDAASFMTFLSQIPGVQIQQAEDGNHVVTAR